MIFSLLSFGSENLQKFGKFPKNSQKYFYCFRVKNSFQLLFCFLVTRLHPQGKGGPEGAPV